MESSIKIVASYNEFNIFDMYSERCIVKYGKCESQLPDKKLVYSVRLRHPELTRNLKGQYQLKTILEKFKEGKVKKILEFINSIENESA